MLSSEEKMLNPLATLIGTGSFREFVSAVSRTKLTYLLDGTHPCTLIVPTDAAFTRLPPEMRRILHNDLAGWKHLVAHHIIPRRWTISELARQRTFKTMNGKSLPFLVANGIYLSGARVIQSNLSAQNGIIHIVDRVILPTEFISLLSQAEPATVAAA